MSVYIFGHTNPDTDSIVGAISLSYLKNALGEDTLAVAQGEISPESRFVLDRFGIKAPELKTSFAGESVYLVDFSDLAQAPKDIKEATILGIVDHHKLGDITTDTPLECWIRPIGCTNTIIKQMFDYYNIAIPSSLAGAMMLAILSDTVIFKSPTCTKEDTKAVKELSAICGVDDYKKLAMEMFIAKSAVDGASARNINTRDYKAFDMNGVKVGIGQMEMVDISVLEPRHSELLEDMQKMKAEGTLHTIIILLTDIMKEGSLMLTISDDISKVESAFKIKVVDNRAYLDGVLSRKKQVIPVLQPQF